MPAEDLLARLRAADVRVWEDGGVLRYSAPPGAFTPELRHEVFRRKAELLVLLRKLTNSVEPSAPSGGPQPGPAATGPRPSGVTPRLHRAVEEFRLRLQRCGLPMFLAAHGASGTRDADLAAASPELGGRLATALDLLVLSRWVPAADAAAVVPPELVEHLVAEGLAETDRDGLRLPALRLVEHHGQLVFVHAVSWAEVPCFGYYGPDSAGLGRLLLGARGRCLDLFASTGAQALVMAGTAREVVLVEADTGMAPVTELNLLLADRFDTAELIWGDALKVDLGEPFDTVSVNAPMMPSFGLDLPWRADGGPDGCRILEAGLRRVPLAPHGQVFADAWLIGSVAHGPSVAWLERLARERSWSVTVVPTGSTRLEPGHLDAWAMAETFVGYGAGGSPQSVHDELTALWRGTGVDRSFACLVHARPSDEPGVTVLPGAADGPGWRL
ncbi:hypothetical protein [Kitasatospora sp. NPDC047058]|uniref:TubC N-terminal docking domain-related protein n=1 Tax=Kitasatospora sp. NPDC047058 TaxID=3155620 RepID=UPI0033E105A3